MTTKTLRHLLIVALLVGLAAAGLQVTNPPPLTSALISSALPTSDAFGAGPAGLKQRTGIVRITP